MSGPEQKSRARQRYEEYGYHSDCPISTPHGDGVVMSEGGKDMFIKLLESGEVGLIDKSEVSFRDVPDQ